MGAVNRGGSKATPRRASGGRAAMVMGTFYAARWRKARFAVARSGARGPPPQPLAHAREVTAIAHDLAIARDGADPGPEPRVRHVGEVHGGQAQQGRAVRPRGGNAELT